MSPESGLGNGTGRRRFRRVGGGGGGPKDGGGDRVDAGWNDEKSLYTESDDVYFKSYAHLGIHEDMIKDYVRTDTYRKAIMKHKELIVDKVVVDVGCGTGILSFFCAQAGAKRVYAIDASDIATLAKEVVKANCLCDKIIVLHGRVEDVNIEEKVDVIISEWMGYMLLYESMLSSVITARDRWLKPGGLILPSHATLYMAPITNTERYSESIDFWNDVYGINMSALLPFAKQCAFEEPCVEAISGENILTWPHGVKHINCYAVTIQELESITTRYRFMSMMGAPCHGFAFWFDVEFSEPTNITIDNDSSHSTLDNIQSCSFSSNDSRQQRKRQKTNDVLVLSTAPEAAPTHWFQTLVYLLDPIDVEQDQVIEGCLTLSQNKENSRFLDIHLEYSGKRWELTYKGKSLCKKLEVEGWRSFVVGNDLKLGDACVFELMGKET